MNDKRIKKLKAYRAALERAVEKMPTGYPEASHDRDEHVSPVELRISDLTDCIGAIESDLTK